METRPFSSPDARKPLGSRGMLGKIDSGWALVAAVVLITFLLVTLKPDPYMRILNAVKDGIWVTLKITLISFVLVLFVGLIGGLGRISKNGVIRGIATVYVEVVRGIPLLVQLMYWYFAFPAIIRDLGAWLNIASLASYRTNAEVMAILGFTFCYGAYMSEIYRAGIQSITKGQMEAARSLGMTYVQGMRYVVIPQAIRVILPPVGNELVTLLKDSSLVSAVSLPDLTRRGREWNATNFRPIETYTMIALVYLIMTLLAARLAVWIEKKTALEK